MEGSPEDSRKCYPFYLECKSLPVFKARTKVTPVDDVQYVKFVLQSELGLARRKRESYYANMIYFVHLGTQLWQNDLHKYEMPGIRIEVWAEIQLHAFTSAKVSEYLESTCRAGSGRGLHFQVPFLSYCWVAHTVLTYMILDIAFGVFRNEHGMAKFAMQAVRMTFRPGTVGVRCLTHFTSLEEANYE